MEIDILSFRRIIKSSTNLVFHLTMLLVSLNSCFVLAQNTIVVSRCNNSSVYANGSSSSTLPINITTTDFPAGYVVTDVSVVVNWSRTIGSCSGGSGTDNVSEVGFSITGPSGNQRYLAVSNSLSGLVGLPSSTWTATGSFLNVVHTFQTGAPLPTALPLSSVISPAQSISSSVPLDFLGDSPFGNWFLTVFDDNLGLTGTCLVSYCVTITACPGTISASCRSSVNLNLDSFGIVSPSFAAINLNSDTSCLLSSVVFSPSGPFTCGNVPLNSPFNLTMTLTDRLGNTSSCNSTVRVLDVTAPDVPECRSYPNAVDTVYLNTIGTATYNASSAVNPSDACGISSVLIANASGVFGSSVNFNCSNRGPNNLFIRATDNNNNTRSLSGSSFQPSCRIRVLVFDTFPPTALCRNQTVYLDNNGSANVTTAMVDNGSTDVCTPSALLIYSFNGFTSANFDCSNTGTNNLVMTVLENNTAAQGGPRSANCNSVITVIDTTKPIAICSNVNRYLNSAGNVSVSASSVASLSSDNCGPLAYTFSTGTTRSYDCSSIGSNIVSITVTDPSGNSSFCSSTITILDTVQPTAFCNNRTVFLNSSGLASIPVSQLDNSSIDACGISSVSVNGLSILNFGCSDIGTQNLTLSVIDNNSNVGTCISEVTVLDTIKPLANCKNINAYLGVNGLVTVSAIDINDNSFDICGISTYTINGFPSLTYSCSNIGVVPAILTVTDAGGNLNSCSSQISVLDTIRPVLNCQNINAYLDNFGTISINPSQLVTLSNDNCAIPTLLINGSSTISFDCNDIGLNNVIITSSDNYSNTNTCSADVTVLDTVDPIASCRNFSVNILNSGIITIPASDLNGVVSSSDACGPLSFTVNGQPNFQLGSPNIGPNNILLTVTDANNNSSSCFSVINVIPNWTVDTINYTTNPNSSIQFCIPLPPNFGTPVSFTILNSPNYGTLNGLSQINCFEYFSGNNTEVTDSIRILVCNQYGYCDTSFIQIRILSCVWPGDANDDNIVNNFDILPMGLSYGNTGVVRSNSSILFDCQPSEGWGINTPISLVDFKHSDSNGDGIITGEDTSAIVLNWGETHLRPGNINFENTSQVGNFYVDFSTTYEGRVVRVPIILGDINNPVDSAYGLAFTIFYDNTLVDSASVFVSFDSSWLGTRNSNMITVTKDNYQFGQVSVGMTRTNNQNIFGYGKIGDFQLKVKENILQGRQSVNLIMGIGLVNFIDNQENPVLYNTMPSYITILADPNSTEYIYDTGIDLYPNPASSNIIIKSNSEDLVSVKILNYTGAEIMHYNKLNDGTMYIDVSTLKQGIYFAQVQTNKGIVLKKFAVSR